MVAPRRIELLLTARKAAVLIVRRRGHVTRHAKRRISKIWLFVKEKTGGVIHLAHERKTSFWSISAAEALSSLNTTAEGLHEYRGHQAADQVRTKHDKEKTRLARTAIALNQFRSPLILILLVAGIVTFAIKRIYRCDRDNSCSNRKYSARLLAGK